MSSEFRNATTGRYCLGSKLPDGPWHPADPPENTGGGLAGDPVKSDYVYAPESIDPPEPEPPVQRRLRKVEELMADIGKLSGITTAEAQDLRKKCGIYTIEALWLRISSADSGWKWLTDKSGIEKKRLIDLLAAEGMRQQGFAGAWFKRHWSDVLILLVVLGLALGIWRRL